MFASKRPLAPVSRRIEGLDLARALAAIGMLSVHVAPSENNGVAAMVYGIAHGRASLLFVMLAGIGIALAGRSPERRGELRLKLIWTGVVLLVLGLALQTLDHGVAVILHYYALYFLLGTLLVGLPTRWLALIALVWTVLGPLAYLIGSQIAPELFMRHLIGLGDDPIRILEGLFISGYYPLLTWGPALVWGLWLGRQDLRAHETRTMCICGGAFLALTALAFGVIADINLEYAGIWAVFDVTPHSQMPLWLIGGLGSAAAVLGISLIAVDRFPRFIEPLIALGQMALTFYVAHLLGLAVMGSALRHESVGAAVATVLALTALAAGAAMLWRDRFIWGPVERLTRAPWQDQSRWRPTPSARWAVTIRECRVLPHSYHLGIYNNTPNSAGPRSLKSSQKPPL